MSRFGVLLPGGLPVHTFTTLTIGTGERQRQLNAVELQIPESKDPVILEKWELFERLQNLVQFGYDTNAEVVALREWPRAGVDRTGRRD